MPEILENADEKLTARMRRLLDFLWQEWKHLQLQIGSLSEDLEKIASSDSVVMVMFFFGGGSSNSYRMIPCATAKSLAPCWYPVRVTKIPRGWLGKSSRTHLKWKRSPCLTALRQSF